MNPLTRLKTRISMRLERELKLESEPNSIIWFFFKSHHRIEKFLMRIVIAAPVSRTVIRRNSAAYQQIIKAQQDKINALEQQSKIMKGILSIHNIEYIPEYEGNA